MANIGFKLDGAVGLKAKFRHIRRKLVTGSDGSLYKAVNKGGQRIRTEAVKAISKGARSGKTYKRGSKTHQASAAGEFPKTDTGNLVNNITVERDGKHAVTVGSRIQAPEGYWLETKELSQGGRRWLEPIFNKNKKKIVADIAKVVKKAVEGQ